MKRMKRITIAVLIAAALSLSFPRQALAWEPWDWCEASGWFWC